MNEVEKGPADSASESPAAGERPQNTATTRNSSAKGKKRNTALRLVIELLLLVAAAVAFCVVCEARKFEPWCLFRAYLGSAEMQCALGEIYSNPEDPDKLDMEKATWWLRKADAQGYPDAALMLADLAKNDKERLRWTERAADGGSPEAQYQMGMHYSAEQRHDKAVMWYEKAAKQGLDKAQHTLGGCYRRGDGVKQDLAKAKEWYELAAAQDYGPSQRALEELGVSAESSEGK